MIFNVFPFYKVRVEKTETNNIVDDELDIPNVKIHQIYLTE